MIFLLDTNTVAYLLRNDPLVTQHRDTALREGHTLALCPPVEYEILRGLLKSTATRQVRQYQQEFRPLHQWIPLLEEDWLQAARFWTRAVSRGKQLSDIDLLLVVIAFREDAIIVSNDTDFDVLPIQRVDWRQSAP